MAQKKTANGDLPPRSIFHYLDYREFLKDAIDTLKQTRPNFSMRAFAKSAGLGSHSYFRMIINGERNLSLEGMNKFARALKLGKKESHYLETLVLYGQSKTESDKDRYFDQLIALRPRTVMQGITPDLQEYLSDSFFVTLREMVALPGFVEDAEWIARHVYRKVSPSFVKHALQLLERLGLVFRDAQGNLKHSGRTLEAPRSLKLVEMLQFHRQILSEARNTMVQAPYPSWEAVSMTVPLSPSTMAKLMELWQKTFTEAAHIINQGERDFGEVYQVNLQMFPVTRTKNGRLSDQEE